jgi:hypothetical protein
MKKGFAVRKVILVESYNTSRTIRIIRLHAPQFSSIDLSEIIGVFTIEL